jgi:hypothetical protein
MPVNCNPETLAGLIPSLVKLKGDRTSEAVKTWLLTQVVGNNSTPESLWATTTSNGYGKLTLKQADQGIVFLLCHKTGGNCTPEALNAAAVALQKFTWQQFQAAIIYLLAVTAGKAINAESFANSAITLGFQKLPMKALRQIQAYLLAVYAFGSLTPKQLNLDTVCWQCVGRRELLAQEVFGYCQLA